MPAHLFRHAGLPITRRPARKMPPCHAYLDRAAMRSRRLKGREMSNFNAQVLSRGVNAAAGYEITAPGYQFYF